MYSTRSTSAVTNRIANVQKHLVIRPGDAAADEADDHQGHAQSLRKILAGEQLGARADQAAVDVVALDCLCRNGDLLVAVWAVEHRRGVGELVFHRFVAGRAVVGDVHSAMAGREAMRRGRRFVTVLPLPVALRAATALRSGDFGSPVLVWSHPRKGEGAGRSLLSVVFNYRGKALSADSSSPVNSPMNTPITAT